RASTQWEDRQERFFGSFCLLGGSVGAQVRGPVVPDRAHDRQAGVDLGGEGDPACPFRVAGASVEGWFAFGDATQFPDRGFEFGVTHHGGDPLHQGGHLANASTVLRGGEVGADPTARIDALADVYTPYLCIGEHVHTGCFGTHFGQVNSCHLSPVHRLVR